MGPLLFDGDGNRGLAQGLPATSQIDIDGDVGRAYLV